METIVESKKTLAQLTEPVTIYPQLLKNVKVRSKQEAREDQDVQAIVDQVTNELGDEGRILLRESGTEPVIRVMVEASSDEICSKYVNQVIDVIKSKGHVVD